MRRGSGFVFPFSLMRAGVVSALPFLLLCFRSSVSVVLSFLPLLVLLLPSMRCAGSCARGSVLPFFFLPADGFQNGARKTGGPGMYGMEPGYTLSILV